MLEFRKRLLPPLTLPPKMNCSVLYSVENDLCAYAFMYVGVQAGAGVGSRQEKEREG